VLGILLSGAAYLPIDPRWPAQRRAYLLEQGDARIVVTQQKLNDEFEWAAALQRVCLSPEDAFAGAPLVRPAEQSIDDLAYVIFTSGSTGTPKGVMIDHKGAVNTVLHINRLYGVSGQDKVLAVSELTFDLSVYDLFGVLAAGGTVVIPDVALARDPEHWLAMVRRHGVTVWNSVPQLMSMLVDMVELSSAEPLSLRLVMMSGDWIPVRLPERIKAICPDVAVIGMGGATEGSIWSIYYRIEAVQPQWESIPYGKALPNQQMHVLDGQLQPCPDWITGDIYIGGVGVALGYWKNPVQTQAQFVLHPHSGERLYKTGDLGRMLPGGDIEFLGRVDQQVKVRGFRIELGEIEAQLRRHAQVREVVVIVREDAPSEKRLVAYFTTDDEQAPGAEQLRAHLQQSLPEYMVPSAYVALEVLPLTSNGKVDKKALPRPELGAGSAQHYQAPQGETELLLAQIWQELLSVERVGRHDNFFELGGHSLVAIQILKSVQQRVDATITLRDILRFPTIAELSASVDGTRESMRIAENPTRLRDGRRHPLFFVHTVYGDPDHYSALANLLTVDLPVYGLHVLGRDPGSLQNLSMQELASSHIHALQKIEPHGPYSLAGHSSGGLLAYEMARQLMESGRKVDFVGLIDVHDLSASDASDDQATDSVSDLLTLLRVTIGEHTGIVDGPSLQEIVPAHTPDPRAAFDNLIRSRLIPEQVSFEDVVRRAANMAALRKMAYDYVPPRLAANVHLFAAAESVRKAPRLRWKPEVAGDWPIHVISGDHTSIVAPPNIRILADAFSSQLRDACAQPDEVRSFAESVA
jgi:pyochelin synthetase